jgi:hypothetical protein
VIEQHGLRCPKIGLLDAARRERLVEGQLIRWSIGYRCSVADNRIGFRES